MSLSYLSEMANKYIHRYPSGIFILISLTPMSFLSDSKDLVDAWTGGVDASPQVQAELRGQAEAFCAADTLASQSATLTQLLTGIWHPRGEHAFHMRLVTWVTMLEQDDALRNRFQQGIRSILASLDSLSFFAETGLPGQHVLYREIVGRLFQHWLPAPREESDTVRLFSAIFRSERAVQRFLDLDQTVFARIAAIFWSGESHPRLHQDLHEALRLLAARVSARGTSRAVRQRSEAQAVEKAPSYALVFATENLIRCEESRPPNSCMEPWLNSVFACRGEVALVRLHMEETGANAPLVFDLGAMDRALDRMELLAANLVKPNDWTGIRRLLNTLIEGILEDTRISTVIQQNFNLLARKTVERTGHGGEHYIAHNRPEYWAMWRAAIGGGFLTVFTAAIKLHIVDHHRAPFMEWLLIGTNYAISFLLLQLFGLALATKQPAMTGATLANIINRNRGSSRFDEITEFSASISRTQIAAAVGNILAVSSGAVIFNLVWLKVFHSPYVHTQQAEKVYLSLRPLASATAIDAALTGVLLWLAGLIGGWFENFAVYHRIPAAIADHPLRRTLGDGAMQKLADSVDRNIGPWSTSISLGYLLAAVPVVAEFFGLPLDVRHVTLNTGMFAFSASRFGWSAFASAWLYAALVGIAVMFVLNLGVSFALASFVALRAYNVSHKERVALLRYVLSQLISKPLRFILPPAEKQPEAVQPAQAA